MKDSSFSIRISLDQNEQKTSAVLTNGLNPIWNHLMQFSICIPELCLIRFTVKDSDKSSTDLGQYSIPFLSMQHGKSIRSISLIPTLFF
jgi:Ca2+-dependent lipid-binding protein